MKTFYIIYLLLACQSIITGLSAQTVSGKLVDEKNEPMPYANVVLLSLPDSAFVSGTISGDDGTFSLSATAQPQIVRISSIGYTTIYRPVNPADMGIVRLTACDGDYSCGQRIGKVRYRQRPARQDTGYLG